VRWRSLAAASTALGWAMLACLLAMPFGRGVPALRARFGAIERAFYPLRDRLVCGLCRGLRGRPSRRHLLSQ